MAFKAVTTNGLSLFTSEKSGIAKMLDPTIDQLNLKPTVSNVRAWIIAA